MDQEVLCFLPPWVAMFQGEAVAPHSEAANLQSLPEASSSAHSTVGCIISQSTPALVTSPHAPNPHRPPPWPPELDPCCPFTFCTHLLLWREQGKEGRWDPKRAKRLILPVWASVLVCPMCPFGLLTSSSGSPLGLWHGWSHHSPCAGSGSALGG